MFERYYRELLNFLSRKVADRSVAADLTQESYARVYSAQASGSMVDDPRALLYQTARNLAIDHLRHRDVRGGVEMAGEDLSQTLAPGPRHWEPETALSSQQGIAALAGAIDRLPTRCREAFMLNRFEGLSYAEVAARMGISVKAVEQHIKLALDACERCHRQASGTAAAPAGPRRKLHRSRHD